MHGGPRADLGHSQNRTYDRTMSKMHEDLWITTERCGNITVTEQDAWFVADCAKCGVDRQMTVIARNADTNYNADLMWLQCVNCHLPHVSTGWAIFPATSPLSTPGGVEGVELAAWTEVRECLGVGANTAAVMMCRKILLHIAVAQGLPAKNDKDWAPSFAEVNNYLEMEGIITTRMRPWVDLIKDVGNDGAHEINPITQDDARNVARYTEQLLRLTYELVAPSAAP